MNPVKRRNGCDIILRAFSLNPNKVKLITRSRINDETKFGVHCHLHVEVSFLINDLHAYGKPFTIALLPHRPLILNIYVEAESSH